MWNKRAKVNLCLTYRLQVQSTNYKPDANNEKQRKIIVMTHVPVSPFSFLEKFSNELKTIWFSCSAFPRMKYELWRALKMQMELNKEKTNEAVSNKFELWQILAYRSLYRYRIFYSKIQAPRFKAKHKHGDVKSVVNN